MQWWSDSTPTELFALALAFVLGACVGFERQRRLKNAGLRTHTLVSMGSAVFTLVSAYGFSGVLGADVGLDPSRIAAQIVSGVGFLGAGVIFVRGNAVSGLTTAASVWLSAAVGMACGAGLPIVAIASTLFYLVAVTGLTRLGRRFSPGLHEGRLLIVRYRPGQGALRGALAAISALGHPAVLESSREIERDGKTPRIEARIRLAPTRMPVEPLLGDLAEVQGITSVRLGAPAD